jgi:hypothetical protein
MLASTSARRLSTVGFPLFMGCNHVTWLPERRAQFRIRLNERGEEFIAWYPSSAILNRT